MFSFFLDYKVNVKNLEDQVVQLKRENADLKGKLRDSN